MKLLYDLLFPSFCQCCKEKTDQTLFCKHCLKNISFIETHDRCRICFSEFLLNDQICLDCHFKEQRVLKRVLFERAGVASILQKMVIEEENLGIYELVASLFVVRIHRLNWEFDEVRSIDCRVCETLAKEITRIYSIKGKKSGKILLIQEGSHSEEEMEKVDVGQSYVMSFCGTVG